MAKAAAKAREKITAGRPRDARATEAIRRAALELGEELGFEDLTVEAIAARAGVGKTTIYRRWPGVWAVVVDAILADVTQAAPVVSRPTARESFAVSMRLVAKAFRGRHGRLARTLIGRAQLDPSLRKAIGDQWLTARRQLSREIVRRGIETGELRPNLDPDTVLDALYGPLYHRLLLPYDGDEIRLPDTYIDALIDTVFSGLERKRRPER